MTQTTAAALGRKILIEGDALAAVERRADADQTSWKQAADELIKLGIAAGHESIASGGASPTSGAVLSVADTDELFAELRARFETAQSNAVMQAVLDAANARGDAAEATLASMKALLGA